MTGKTNALIQAQLDNVFLNADIPLIGDAAGIQGAAVDGDLYWSLHTADPTAAGNQTSSEAAYTSYARVAAPRDGTGFSRTGQAVSVIDPVTFPTGSGGSGTATHWGLGASASGSGLLMYSGPITPNIVMGAGVTPELAAGTVVTEA